MYFVMVTPKDTTKDTQVFVFYTQAECDEFASCVLSRYDDVTVNSGQTNEATDVFENWSF